MVLLPSGSRTTLTICIKLGALLEPNADVLLATNVYNSPGSVKFTYQRRDTSDPTYLSARLLQKASRFFDTKLRDYVCDSGILIDGYLGNKDDTAEPIAGFTYNESGDSGSLTVFGVWMYAHFNATEWDREEFYRAASVCLSELCIVGECWKLSVEFQSLEFRNWLISNVEKYAVGDWQTALDDLESLTALDLTKTPLANRIIENMAYLVVNQNVSFWHILTAWVKTMEPANEEDPTLLGELLGQMETFNQYTAAGKLFKPQLQVCLKYHKHRSMEEREACGDYRAAEEEAAPELSDDEGEDPEKVTMSLNDVEVDVHEGEYEWMQHEDSKKLVRAIEQ
ncbi:hypothetical protein H2200_007896 [Cladophialophora chaetospira]|uniref:Uncharacterized protein n=1 Tax=Cladophialophora chaetospira TaxID=386627 RepID=A0AA38X6M5_9EURO|nr:hypothetical protein H2200_007896 [Cladophialophora chaetospira]